MTNTKIERKDVENNKIIIDTTLMKVVDLPIHIDSTSYLLHPIGFIKENRSKLSYISKSRKNNASDFSVTSGYSDRISGDMESILFQHIKSNKLLPLTKLNVKINSVEFLRTIFNKTKKQLLLYHVNDFRYK